MYDFELKSGVLARLIECTPTLESLELIDGFLHSPNMGAVDRFLRRRHCALRTIVWEEVQSYGDEPFPDVSIFRSLCEKSKEGTLGSQRISFALDADDLETKLPLCLDAWAPTRGALFDHTRKLH